MKFTTYLKTFCTCGILIFVLCTTSFSVTREYFPIVSYSIFLEMTEKEDVSISSDEEKADQDEVEEQIEEKKSELKIEPKEEKETNSFIEENVVSSPTIEEVEVSLEEEPIETKEESLIMETYLGSLSGYGPDCVGCTSGKTASGYDIGNGTITYPDLTYGDVRIVSGDKKYPFGTIVRIRDCSYFSMDVVAIVLDRGGNVGLDRGVTFDLLFPTEKEASFLGKQNQVTFEILRLGYE